MLRRVIASSKEFHFACYFTARWRLVRKHQRGNRQWRDKNESWQRISTRRGICNHVIAATVQHFHICMLLHRSMTSRSKSSARESTVVRKNESWQRISTRKGICNHVIAATVQKFHICCAHRSMTTRSKSSASEWTAARRRQRGGGDRVQGSILSILLIWLCV